MPAVSCAILGTKRCSMMVASLIGRSRSFPAMFWHRRLVYAVTASSRSDRGGLSFALAFLRIRRDVIRAQMKFRSHKCLLLIREAVDTRRTIHFQEPSECQPPFFATSLYRSANTRSGRRLPPGFSAASLAGIDRAFSQPSPSTPKKWQVYYQYIIRRTKSRGRGKPHMQITRS